MTEHLTNAITSAYWRVRALLLEPADPARIAVLALLMFLTNCSSVDANFNTDTSSINDMLHIGQAENGFAFAAGAAVGMSVLVTGVIVVVALIVLTLLFLSSRASFMLVDSIASHEPRFDAWNTHATPANRVFYVRGGMFLAFLVLAVGIYLAAVFSLVGVAGAGAGMETGLMVNLGFASLGFLLLPIVFIAYFVDWCIRDLLVPVMYAQPEQGVTGAASLVGRSVEPANLVLYLVMRFLFGLATYILLIPLYCFCCCVMMIPGTWSVLLLPWTLFLRSFTLDWLGNESEEMFGAFRHQFDGSQRFGNP